MFFWYIGTAVFTVGFVFRDPRFDYRGLIVGSVIPLADGLAGGARALHSVTVTIVVLVVVMLTTIGHRALRRSLLGVPIGMFLHLVFDGAWANTDVFWWPFTGWSFGDDPFPPVDRGAVTVLFEIVGLGLCVWIARRNRLFDRQRVETFVRSGQLIVPLAG